MILVVALALAATTEPDPVLDVSVHAGGGAIVAFGGSTNAGLTAGADVGFGDDGLRFHIGVEGDADAQVVGNLGNGDVFGGTLWATVGRRFRPADRTTVTLAAGPELGVLFTGIEDGSSPYLPLGRAGVVGRARVGVEFTRHVGAFLEGRVSAAIPVPVPTVVLVPTASLGLTFSL